MDPNKQFNLTTTELVVKQVSEDSGILRVEGYANCTTKDRAGDIIIEDAWKGDAMVDYLKNPIVLAFHDHTQPIGRMVEYVVDSKGLKIVAEISKASGRIYELIKEGILKAFSVGFRIKDADYDSATDIFIIKEVLLHEISVVSVPCNQDSTFEVSKQFATNSEYNEFKEQFQKGAESNNEQAASDNKDLNKTEDDFNMDPKDLQKLIADGIKGALDEQDKAKLEAERTKAEKEAEDERVTALIKTGTEALMADLEAKRKEDSATFAKAVEELQSTIAEKAEEITQLESVLKSGHSFTDRNNNTNNQNVITDEEAEKAFYLSRVTNKGVFDTKFGSGLKEKAANASSSAAVSSDTYYETVVSTSLERDIQEILVLKPLFREVVLTSANQVIPINPNATAANWVAVAQVSGGARDKTTTGSEITKTLTEITLKTYKLAGKSFITDETDEDAIMPLLPLIREGLVEAHALKLDETLLRGTASANNPTGLIPLAATATTAVTTTAKADKSVKVTGKMILEGRRKMGQYGLNLRDLKLIVSLEAYWDLLEDDNFANLNEVGAQATKLTGQVGTIYGLPVIVSTQFEAPAVSTAYAVLVNTKNYLIPRLRGFVVQSEYQTEEQRRVLVATQRLGFNQIIENKGVATLLYAAA